MHNEKFRTLRNPIFLSSLKLLEMILYRQIKIWLIARKSKKEKVQKKKNPKKWREEFLVWGSRPSQLYPVFCIPEEYTKHNFKATPHQNNLSPRNCSTQ